jgi:hypothetical protein
MHVTNSTPFVTQLPSYRLALHMVRTPLPSYRLALHMIGATLKVFVADQDAVGGAVQTVGCGVGCVRRFASDVPVGRGAARGGVVYLGDL